MAKNNKSKLKNTIALKRNAYATVLSIIFIVAVVALIAFSTALAVKYPLEIDLTTNKEHSISDNNFEYISSVDETIKIYVAATEEEYSSATGTSADLAYIAASQYFIDYNASNARYYSQSVELLKKYADYNDNISVTFIDVYDSKTRDITDNFDDFDWYIGDILVESTFKLDGNDVTRRTVVPFVETYTLEDTSGMAETLSANTYYQMMGYTATSGQGYGYYITENNIETLISSAIYKVTSPDTPVFLVPTSISDNESVAAALQNTLQINNFAVEYNDTVLSTLLAPENYEKYDGIILSDCKSDITVSDRELIEKFLNNNGNKGKSLFYFAGVNTVKLTNICGLLGDWGIGFEEGILYETDESYHRTGDPTILALDSAGSDFTEKSDALGKYFIGSNLTNMRVLWQTNNSATHTRETTVLMTTLSLGQTAVMPSDADVDEWDSTGAETDKRIAAMICEDADTVDNNFVSSYVVAFAAADILSDEYATDTFGNLNLVLDIFNQATGNGDTPFNFVPKKIVTESYYAYVTEGKVRAIRWIFITIVPIVVITLGIVVWIRRKRK